jgi:hypothetical protein
MLLRKIERLEPGMHIRLQMWDDDAPTNYGVSEVIPNGGPFGRSTVRLYRAGEDEPKVFGHNFFPDDLVEIII